MNGMQHWESLSCIVTPKRKDQFLVTLISLIAARGRISDELTANIHDLKCKQLGNIHNLKSKQTAVTHYHKCKQTAVTHYY